jgi:vitamin B12 transporter
MQKKVHQLKSSLTILAMLCFYFTLTVPVSAQTDSTKRLKGVTVKTKPLPALQKTTPVQQISANDFERYSSGFDVADALRDFSGVNVKDYGGIGGLKTVSVRGLGANHTAILYDGIEMNDAQNGQIDLGKLNLNGIQQITLYNAQPDDILAPARSFASASIISIKTVQPVLSDAKPYQFLAGIKSGSFGLINPYFQWQQRMSSTWAFVINSYIESADGRYKFKSIGYGPDSTQTRNNAFVRSQQADGGLYWTKNDSNKFNVHINYYHSNRGLPSAVVPVSHQQLWNNEMFLQQAYQHTWDKFQLLVSTKLLQLNTRYRDPDYLNNQGGLDERFTQREFYQSAALSYRITPHWNVSCASDVSLSDLGIYSPVGSIYKYAFPSRFTLLNVLATKFTKGKWQFQGNFLSTYINEQVRVGVATPARTVLSPTLTASYRPFKSADLLLRAFYKDIFRQPTLDEQYFFSINGSRNLKPEFVKQFDAGVSYRKGLNNFFDYITFTADTYYNIVSNKIIAIPNQNLEIVSITNLGNVRIEGADVGIKTQTKTSSGWRGLLSLNYTYQYAVDVDLNTPYYLQQIPYTPKNTLAANAGVEYNHLAIYFNQIVSSSRYYLGQSNPQNFVDGYAVSDLSFLYKFSLWNNLCAFSAHANNLFDTNYVIVRSFPMPGRSYLFSLQIKI